MCGLVGYLGNKDAVDVLLSSLSLLEYRGYDSAGIAVMDKKEVKVFKDKGRVDFLKKLINVDKKYSLGIGHTRWATHGEVNKTNAHPHTSMNKRFTLVHNGVIENYMELKDLYLKDVNLISETDSEVIVNLLAYFCLNNNIIDSIKMLISVLKGSFALVVLDKESEDTIYVIKNKTPLLIGSGKEDVMVSSDYISFPSFIDDYVYLDDMQYGVIKEKEYKVYDSLGNIINLKKYDNSHGKEDISKGKYPHFMLKEIEEIPEVIDRLCAKYIYNNRILIDKDIKTLLETSDIIYVASCGTSYHASLYFKHVLEKECNKKVECLIASEYISSFSPIGNNPLVIVVSQSGETQDVISFINNAKEKKIKVLCITNVPFSSIDREGDFSLYLEAKREIAVASTKAYVSEIIVFYFLASLLMNNDDIMHEVEIVNEAIVDIIKRNKELDKIVDYISKKDHLFYIGRNLGYYASLEASLKLKEISYIHSEGIPSSELKHGTIALVSDGFPLIALSDNRENDIFVRSNLKETESRGGKQFVISYESIGKNSDDFSIKLVSSSLRIIPLVVVSQYIAYKCAVKRGNDVDKPRNLAKSVTVL